MLHWLKNLMLGLTLALVGTSVGSAQTTAIFGSQDIFHPVFATNGMVATQEAMATQIGLDVLQNGGNAIDAGVAVGFALAVTLPRAGNLGGGGFMIIHSASSGETVALDFREMAPAAAFRDMYLDEDGNAVAERSRFTYLAAGVPGSVAGLALAAERYGTMPLADLIAPAIELAENGMTVSPDLSNSLAGIGDRLSKWPESARIFYKEDGSNYQPGDTLVQADLAESLKLIAEQGPSAFYEGEIAQKIVADMEANGGLITQEDMKNYRPVIREPIRGNYRGYEIVSMPPPSSGGIHVVQILNMLEHFPIGELGHNSASTIHRMAEAMKLAYADRSEYLGDTDFVDVPVSGLTSKDYAAELVQQIDLTRARPASEIKPNNPVPYESNETTHYSVMDQDGNVVSTTYTINFSYGSGIVAKDTGILLNNEMDDFALKPGTPNAFGVMGFSANAVVPGKRMLSSMTPTIMSSADRVVALGAPGGSRIITQVLLAILAYDAGMSPQQVAAVPRIHHQWMPDVLSAEPNALAPDVIARLQSMGHTVNAGETDWGNLQTVQWDREAGTLSGGSDPRRPGGKSAVEPLSAVQAPLPKREPATIDE